MRLGDIYPRKDVVLVLGNHEYKVNPPSLETLASVEQWYEGITGQKKRWHEIFGDTRELTTRQFAEFIKIMLDYSNEVTPTLDGMMKMINTGNFSACCEAIAKAVQASAPEATGEKSSGNSAPAAWESIMRSGIEFGLGYEEMKGMTMRELYALLVEQPKQSKEQAENVVSVDGDHSLDWLKELRTKNVVPTDWRKQGIKPPETPMDLNAIAQDIAQAALVGV